MCRKADSSLDWLIAAPSPSVPQKDPIQEGSLHLPSWEGPHQGEDQRQLWEHTRSVLGGPFAPSGCLIEVAPC